MSEYRRLQRKLKTTLKNREDDYNRKLLDQLRTDRKKWQFINRLRNPTACEPSHIASLRNSFGHIITDAKKISELLNYKFSTLGTYYGRKREFIPRANTLHKKTFSFRFVTSKETLNELLHLNPNKPNGPAEVPAWALRDAAQSIHIPLTIIVNNSIRQCIFPHELKKAEVTPIFKSGDAQDPTNYRPISITAPLAKIFERLLLQQINAYLDDQHILIDQQFGFRKARSTKDALVFLTDSIRVELDNNNFVACAALDLSKAFDSISHSILKSKLTDVGFSAQAIELLENFLTNRIQRVHVNETKSEWINIKQGVPQGTILGPVLFLLYINDLESHTNGINILQYADDTLIYAADRVANIAKQKIEKSLEKLVTYYESNLLQLNTKKTEFIMFCRDKQREKIVDMKLTVAEDTVKVNSSITYLGICLEYNLNFDQQVRKCLKKMACAIKSVAHIRGNLPTSTRLILLKSLILSQLDYPIILFTSLQKTQLKSIDKQINWGIKTAFFRRKRDRSADLKQKHEILSAESFMKYSCVNFLLRILKRKTTSFNGSVKIPGLNFDLNSRTYHLLQGLKPNSNFTKNSFSAYTTALWNYLPRNIKRDLLSRKDHKQALKKHYLKEQIEQDRNCELSKSKWDDHWTDIRLKQNRPD